MKREGNREGTREGICAGAHARALACVFAAAMLLAARPARAQSRAQTEEKGDTTTTEGAGPKGETQPPAPPAPPDTTETPPPPFSFAEPFAWPVAVERVAVNGYVLPQFELVSLPTALPRDQVQYGARGSRAGFALHGTPYEGWGYMVHVVLVPAGTESLAILSPTANQVASVTVSTATGTEVDVEEASVSYRPVKWYLGKLGFVRIPFSQGQMTQIPKQMFPIRPAQTTAFQNGADVGFLNTLPLFDARLQANLGVFFGSSLGLNTPNQTVRGAVFAGSIEAHPLGAMPLREGDQARGPFRFAVGFASLYRRATSYDTTGYEASEFTDTRLGVSLRTSWKGIYLQGEYLRRMRTDTLSARPSVAESAYAEGSYYLPVKSVAFGPLLRVGTLSDDEDFAPRKFTSFEGGIAFFPRSDLAEPDRLRIIAEYLGASVSPLSEVEREGLLQLQLEW
jgi:hypothetical protein